jgi:hypothetical protein
MGSMVIVSTVVICCTCRAKAASWCLIFSLFILVYFDIHM